MTGQGLDGFDGHARFFQTGETGVAQLVAGPMDQSGPDSGGAEDLVQPLRREGLTSSRSLQGNEQVVSRVRRVAVPC